MRNLLLALVYLAAAAAAQNQFEVASIHPAAVHAGREGGNRSRIEHTPNSLTMWNVNVATCVEWAYELPPFQVATSRSAPDSYDIVAKAGTSVTVAQLRLMLRDLLATRFKLAFHRQSKMLPVYELTVNRGGPKLPKPNAASPVHAAESLPTVDGDAFLFAGVSLDQFARMLSQLRGVEFPVINHTGIEGTYDLALKSAPSAAREADTAALFAILQSQLGLKLSPSKAPFDVVIIDHVEKPSEN
jgi:uncharacterized protein (TIGR03435 family)